MKIRTLIVDDEPLAREWVRNGLQDEADIEIIGECGDGFEAVKAITEWKPHLVLLDVQMPGLDGFGVLSSVEPQDLPAVIFVTAFDRYALKAFEAHAVDYLMKPFSSERLHAAVERARGRDRPELLAGPQGRAPCAPAGHPARAGVPRVAAHQEGGAERLPPRLRHRLDRVLAQQRAAPRGQGNLPLPRDDGGHRVEARSEEVLPHPPFHDRPHRKDQGDASLVQRRLRGDVEGRHAADAVLDATASA